jgi:hypothetical protein
MQEKHKRGTFGEGIRDWERKKEKGSEYDQSILFA